MSLVSFAAAMIVTDNANIMSDTWMLQILVVCFYFLLDSQLSSSTTKTVRPKILSSSFLRFCDFIHFVLFRGSM